MKRKNNKILLLGPIAVVSLTKGKNTIIDRSDIPKIQSAKWFASSTGGKNPKWYAMANIQTIQTRMHRVLLRPPNGLHVDHANGLTLDNRRSNLRIATRSQNLANSRIKPNRQHGAIYKGVYRDLRRNQWVSQITVNRKVIYVGSGTNQQKVAQMYLKAAKKYQGKFARLDKLTNK